jgi:hypothetical protein
MQTSKQAGSPPDIEAQDFQAKGRPLASHKVQENLSFVQSGQHSLNAILFATDQVHTHLTQNVPGCHPEAHENAGKRHKRADQETNAPTSEP